MSKNRWNYVQGDLFEISDTVINRVYLIEKGYTNPKTKKMQDHYDKIFHVALLNCSIKVKKNV